MPTVDDLKQMQGLPLELKIIKSQRRIKEFYSRYNGMVYVSFSGGKDSTVLKHLVETTPDVHDVPSVFINTGLEYPEIQKFAKAQKNVEVIYPEMRFDEVIKKYGYPVISKVVAHIVGISQRNGAECKTYKYLDGSATQKDNTPSLFDYKKWQWLVEADFKVSSKCCDVMKKKPAKEYNKKSGRHPIIGTLADESNLRYTKWLKYGCNAFDLPNPTSTPISFWTEQDILEYIRRFNLPYCSVYGNIVEDQEGNLKTTGCNRTGCIFCMFGVHLEKEPNRFQKLQKTHPRQYEYCIKGGEYVDGKWQPSKKGLGLGHILDEINVEYIRTPDLFEEEEK